MYIDYKSKDRDFGIKKELELLEDLKILFNDESITKTEDRFNLFDFRTKSGFIECKTRRCNSNTYLTTIIGMNKIDNIDPTLSYYFVFQFTDDILFCKYNQLDFNGFEKRIISRRDRGRVESALYCCIPISYLCPFKSTSNFL